VLAVFLTSKNGITEKGSSFENQDYVVAENSQNPVTKVAATAAHAVERLNQSVEPKASVTAVKNQSPTNTVFARYVARNVGINTTNSKMKYSVLTVVTPATVVKKQLNSF